MFLVLAAGVSISVPPAPQLVVLSDEPLLHVTCGITDFRSVSESQLKRLSVIEAWR